MTLQEDEDLGDLLLEVLPADGSTIGNMSAREAFGWAIGRQISEEEYEAFKVAQNIEFYRYEVKFDLVKGD